MVLQHRLFVKDPWELIAEATHRAVTDISARDAAHSFRRQAHDYFQTATVADELAVKPVLLYYAFLNLSKTFAITRGNVSLTSAAYHGLSADPNAKSIPKSSVRFDRRRSPAVFEELNALLDGSSAPSRTNIPLAHLLPQILPGHRLWGYATNRQERFVAVERFELLHSPATKHVWLNILVNRSDLDRLGLTDRTALSHSGLQATFEIIGESASDTVLFQQRVATPYSAAPIEALGLITTMMQNQIWETVRIISPYRKPYIYCSPTNEQVSRLPQISSIYLLMFFLGSVTRYSPAYFEELFESKYGPFFEAFISESAMQFLYLMASEILSREVSKPAII